MRIACFLLIWLIGCAVASAADGRRPNILVFLADDLSVRDLPPYGSADVRAPNLSAFAREGLVFERAFVASPTCAPSRAALLTGLLPQRNGAIANHSYKRDDVVSLPPAFGALGYQTASFGKVAHGPRDMVRHGFDYAPRGNDLNPTAIAQWLEKRDRSRPVCLFVGTKWPHVPWPKNEGYDPATVTLRRAHYDTPEFRRDWVRYLSAVSRADRDFGEILAMVRRELGPDTLVVFSADHGAQVPFGKFTLYDEGIRAPLLMAWPGKVPAGARTSAMVSWLDLLPTLLDLAGGTPPADIDGRSFASVVRDAQTTHRDRIFTIHNNDGRANVYPIRSVRTERWKYIRNLQPGWVFSSHSDRFRKEGTASFFESWESAAVRDPLAASTLNRYRQRPAEELYDLSVDSDELNNLAADSRFAATLVELRGELDAWMKSTGDTGRVEVAPWLPGEPGLLEPAKSN
jgi:uncharacterized sulfatase